MKKLIILAMLVTASIFRPAKAQVSLSVNIGPQPYYQPVYYRTSPTYVYVEQPRYVNRSYYVPAKRYVATKRYYNASPRTFRSTRVYRTNYYSAPRYKQHHKGPKHYGKHGGRKHGRD